MVGILEELAKDIIFLFLFAFVVLVCPLALSFLILIIQISQSSKEDELIDKIMLHVVINIHNISLDLIHFVAFGDKFHFVVLLDHPVAVHSH